MKKPMKQFFCILLSAALVFSINGCSKKEAAEKPFLEFANDIFTEQISTDTVSLHYTLADPSAFGVSSFEPTLGKYGYDETEEEISKSEGYLKELKSYTYDSLTEEEKLIYDCLKTSLDSDLLLKDFIYLQESLGPTTGLQAQLPVLLAEYTFYDKSDINDYIKVLEDIDDYFSQIIQFEKEKSEKGFFMNDKTANDIINQCTSFISDPENNLLIECFNEKVENFKGLTRDEITLYEEQNRDAVLNSVIPAYQNLIDALTGLLGTAKNEKGLSGFSNGKDYYELQAKAQTGSSKSIQEMKEALKNEYQSCMGIIATLQRKDPTLLDQLDTITFPSSDPNEIMEYLKTSVKNDFPLLEDVNYSIKYVHKSLQEFLSPAMYLVPPIDNYGDNNIYVNKKPEYDMSQIFPTIAHEGYPGHLYQNVYFRQSNPHPIRSLLSPTGYSEGWATYVEAYSYELSGLNENLAALLAANMLAIHCLYSLTDIGINYDGWSKNDTISFWSAIGLGAADAEDIYNTMIAEPGVYLPYAVGCIEFLELREQAEEQLSNQFSLKDFHTFLMDLGPAPFDIVKSRMDTWLKSKQ